MEISALSKWHAPKISDELRLKAFSKATEWAIEKCYLPCSYEMCGAIKSVENDKVVVYVSYPFHKLKKGQIGFASEAEIEFNFPDFSVIKETMWHSGCRSSADDFELFNSK